MQFVKVSSALLAVSLLLPQASAYAAPYALSNQSKHSVATAAAIAGIAGGMFGYLISPSQPHMHTQQKQSLWAKIKALPWDWILIPAAVASTAVGFYSYYNTPEKLQEWSDKAFMEIEHDITFKMATNDATTVGDFKNLNAAKSKWPLVRTSENIKAVKEKLEVIKKSLMGVMQSGISYLSDIAGKLLNTVESAIDRISKCLTALADNPEFLKEEVAFANEQVKIAQSEARAANCRTAAVVAYNAFKDQDKVIVYSPYTSSVVIKI